jgi:hypothetical protein
VYVVDHGVTESAIELITNCLAGGMLETAGEHDRNYASFFSANDWSSLTPAEQTEVIALLASLTFNH